MLIHRPPALRRRSLRGMIILGCSMFLRQSWEGALRRQRLPGAQASGASAAHDAGPAGEEDASSDSEALGDDLGELGAAEAQELLEEKRAELMASGVGTASHFQYDVRGGQYCFEHHGVVWDSVRAEARTAEGKNFLHRYAMPRSVTFARHLYGPELCETLAEYWCQKCRYFLGIAQRMAGARSHVFTQAEIDGFPPPPAFVAALSRAEGRVLERMKALQQIQPAEPRS